jgi:mevalonate kinase
MSRTYPAKLLLFGEYSVLNGSQALAVPLNQWSGYWTNEDLHPNFSPAEFIHWLFEKNIIAEEEKKCMTDDFKNGWSFASSIPIGHGVGSSGAYVAAIFDRYLIQKKYGGSSDPSAIMANMESFFHGSSSGMDPLVSFENKAVLKDESGVFHVISDPGWPEGYKVYLWDSGISRTTGPLVNAFKNQMLDAEFLSSLQRTLIPVVDHAIHFYLSGTSSMLEECISVISQFQRSYFTPMIPDPVMTVWDEVQQKRGVYMKLCGAGGGGYYLIISAAGEDIAFPGLFQIH